MKSFPTILTFDVAVVAVCSENNPFSKQLSLLLKQPFQF